MKGGSIIMADWDHWGRGNTTEQEGKKKKDRDVTAEVSNEME
jgi:hypothetical protein